MPGTTQNSVGNNVQMGMDNSMAKLEATMLEMDAGTISTGEASNTLMKCNSRIAFAKQLAAADEEQNKRG